MIRRKSHAKDYVAGTRSEAAIEALAKQGLDVAPKPKSEGIPDLPKDLTDLSEKELMALYAEYVAWSDYATSQFACAVVDEKEAERQVSLVEATKIAQLRTQGVGVTDARAAVKVLPVVVAVREELVTKEAYRRMLETVVETCEKRSNLTSRELTRRTSGMDRNRRAGNTWIT